MTKTPEQELQGKRQENIAVVLRMIMENLDETPYEWQEHDATDVRFSAIQRTTWAELVRRRDDHFVLRVAAIEPLTAEGKATARLLKLNLDKCVVERQLLAAVGRYPR